MWRSTCWRSASGRWARSSSHRFGYRKNKAAPIGAAFDIGEASLSHASLQFLWLEANAGANLDRAVSSRVCLGRSQQIPERAWGEHTHAPRIEELIVVQDVRECALKFQSN